MTPGSDNEDTISNNLSDMFKYLQETKPLLDKLLAASQAKSPAANTGFQSSAKDQQPSTISPEPQDMDVSIVSLDGFMFDEDGTEKDLN